MRTILRRGLRRRRSRGQALVEFAIFFLLLMVLVAGVTDTAGLLNDHVNLEFAARQGARTGSVLGNQSYADCAIIGAIQAALVNMPSLTVTQISIYDANSSGQPQSASLQDIYAGNTTCTVSGSTVTFSPAALQIGYPPANRNNTPFYEDSIGVQIKYNYQFEFGLVGGGTFSASDYAVMPVNPVAVASPNPTPTPIATQ